MSTDVTVAGGIDSALTHFAGLGLAGIMEAAGAERVRLHWSDSTEPELHVRVPGWNDEQIAAALASHAATMDREESWVHARIDHEGRAGTGLFSPRIKPPASRDSWELLADERRRIMDQLLTAGDLLSLDFIGGLGEPAYWRFDPRGEPRPDHGASRWEMKARNRGEEFVGDRLSKMSSAVVQRQPEDILAGIRGQVQVDELDGKPGSQTATGLQRPGPVDAALAWVGLWGLTAFPVAHDAHHMSRTPGASPQEHQWPTVMCLPVVTRPTTLDRLRWLITSEAMAVVGSSYDSPGTGGAEVTTALSLLNELGVVACAVFPVERRGSDSAPQRIVLDAELRLAEKGPGR